MKQAQQTINADGAWNIDSSIAFLPSFGGAKKPSTLPPPPAPSVQNSLAYQRTRFVANMVASFPGLDTALIEKIIDDEERSIAPLENPGLLRDVVLMKLTAISSAQEFVEVKSSVDDSHFEQEAILVYVVCRGV